VVILYQSADEWQPVLLRMLLVLNTGSSAT
jgi:hypothetical protein